MNDQEFEDYAKSALKTIDIVSKYECNKAPLGIHLDAEYKDKMIDFLDSNGVDRNEYRIFTFISPEEINGG